MYIVPEKDSSLACHWPGALIEGGVAAQVKELTMMLLRYIEGAGLTSIQCKVAEVVLDDDSWEYALAITVGWVSALARKKLGHHLGFGGTRLGTL